MGIFDRFKKTAKEAAETHGDKIKGGLDKAGDFVDEKTGGKHSDKIDQGVEKAKDSIDKLGDGDGGNRPGGTGGHTDGEARA